MSLISTFFAPSVRRRSLFISDAWAAAGGRSELGTPSPLGKSSKVSCIDEIRLFMSDILIFSETFAFSARSLHLNLWKHRLIVSCNCAAELKNVWPPMDFFCGRPCIGLREDRRHKRLWIYISCNVQRVLKIRNSNQRHACFMDRMASRLRRDFHNSYCSFNKSYDPNEYKLHKSLVKECELIIYWTGYVITLQSLRAFSASFFVQFKPKKMWIHRWSL